MIEASAAKTQGRGLSSLAFPLVAFVVAAAVLLPFYRYALGPDGISYVSIASEYASGFWNEAVNAYWGPLYSWFVAILLLLHIPGILAAKIAVFGAGVLALFALHRIAMQFQMDERMRRSFLWVGAAMILAFVMETNSPDLLFTAVLLLYLGILFNPAYPSSRYTGVLCGILGALAYLAKSYGFWFFAIYFTVFTALHWLRSENGVRRKRIALQFLAGLAVFCLISFAWVAALHGKYGRWMLGTTGVFNYRLVGPESVGYPHFQHLIPPGSQHAVTAWQDPSPAWLPAWNSLAGPSALKHQGKLIYANAKHIFEFWTYTTPLFTAFLIGYIVLCLESPGIRSEWIYPLGTIALFSAGYLLISVEDRYLWLTDLLWLWIAFRTLDLLSKRASLSAPARTLLVGATALSLLLDPLLILRSQFLQDRDLYHWAESLKRTNLARGRLASCADWPDSAYVAYVVGMPYYGVPAPVPEAPEVARELNPDYQPNPQASADPNQIRAILSAAQIDYFVVWPSCAPILPATAETVSKSGGLRLLRWNRGNGSLQR